MNAMICSLIVKRCSVHETERSISYSLFRVFVSIRLPWEQLGENVKAQHSDKAVLPHTDVMLLSCLRV